MLGSARPLQWNWFVRNIPWLDTPDQEVNEVYYFRWYVFEKHIECTPDGYLITEFLDNVPWLEKPHSIVRSASMATAFLVVPFISSRIPFRKSFLLTDHRTSF